MRIVPLVLLALALAFPAAAATTAQLAFTPTFGSATLHAEGSLQGGDAAQMRRFMDLAGNQDGTVTSQEAQTFLASFKGTIGKLVGQILTGGNLTLDGNGLVGSEIGDLQVQNAEGSVGAGPPIQFQLDLTFLFKPVDGTTHALRLHGRATPGGVLHMTLSVPGDWHVQTADGLEAGLATGKGVRAVTFDMPGDDREFALTFAADPKGSPDLGLVFALPAVAAAALLMRARKV